jgi:hypothetical protein
MKNDFTIDSGVARITLTQGQFALVDEQDLLLLAPYRWYAARHRDAWYAATNIRLPDGRWRTFPMHRCLLALEFGDQREVDHGDGAGLNNVRSNLRITDTAGNQHNLHGKRRWRDGRVPTSTYPGVCWHKGRSKWQAKIWNRGVILLGYWTDEMDAVEAYRRAKVVRDTGGSNLRPTAV